MERGQYLPAHTNRSGIENTPRTFPMTPETGDVRFGSIATFRARRSHFRFAPNIGHFAVSH